MSTIQPTGDMTGGQGETIALRLDDPKHLRRTLKTLRRSVAQRWAIPSDVRAKLGAEMWHLAQTAEEERVRVSAAQVLAAMMGQCQRDEHMILNKLIPNAGEQAKRGDGGPPTINVQIVNVSKESR